MEADLTKDIPWLASKLYIRTAYPKIKGGTYGVNTERWHVTFLDFREDIPDCFLTSGVSTPIVGQNVVFEVETIREFGESLFFEPVPQEMLVTAATRPQVRVDIDGVPAACRNLNCDYLYVTPAAEVTAIAYDSVNQVLSVTGVNLPTTDLKSLSLGDVVCPSITSNDGSNIVCDMSSADKPTAGSYTTVNLIDSLGRAGHASGIVPIDISLIVTDV